MKYKNARAKLTPVRQRTQYSCMSASMAMCLNALGLGCTEDEVNKVMGARPMKGAAWEQALACAQHYGCRATLTMPSTVEQLKSWTDAEVPVMIAWNPEGREWSHASVVFDVDDDLNVYIADPNIPNPKKTVRVVSEDDFYSKWYEKLPNYLVRRPACAIEREITSSGYNVRMASTVPLKLQPDYGDREMNLKEMGRDLDKISARNKKTKKVTLKTWERKNSRPEVREVPYQFAIETAKKGSQFKAQVIGDFDQILYESKSKRASNCSQQGEVELMDLESFERELMAEEKESRFKEGPEGKKQWKKWFNSQPKSFKEDWEENTDKYDIS